MRDKIKNGLLTFSKGILMGAADLVPGVSGGTIAFITGILDKLIDSISKFDLSLISLIKVKGIKHAFFHVNGPFLLILLSGILTSILSLSHLITWLLAEHPIPIWSFFFGLILISIVNLLQEVKTFNILNILIFAIGVLFAWFITFAKPLNLEPTYLNIFIAGSVALCAMILPGISGSFILLILGLYQTIVAAAKSLELLTLLCFASGGILGLLLFSKTLKYLLINFRCSSLMFLTGIMLGSLPKVWPWKYALTTMTKSNGTTVTITEKLLSPFDYEKMTSNPPLIGLAIFLMLFAIILVFGLNYIGKKCKRQMNHTYTCKI